MALAPNVLASRQRQLGMLEGRDYSQDADMASVYGAARGGVGTMGSTDWGRTIKSLQTGHGSTGAPGAGAAVASSLGYNGTGQARFFPTGANGLPNMGVAAPGTQPGSGPVAGAAVNPTRPNPASAGGAMMAGGTPAVNRGAYPGGSLQNNLRDELWARLQTDEFGLSDDDQQAFLGRGIGQGMEAFTEDAKRRGIYRSNLQMPEQQRMIEGVNADLTQFNAGLAEQQRESLRNQLLGIVGEEAQTGRTQMQEAGATSRSNASNATQRYGYDSSAATARAGLAESGRQYDYDYGLRRNDQQFDQGMDSRTQTDAERRWRAELAARSMWESDRNTMGAYGAF